MLGLPLHPQGMGTELQKRTAARAQLEQAMYSARAQAMALKAQVNKPHTQGGHNTRCSLPLLLLLAMAMAAVVRTGLIWALTYCGRR